MEIEACISHVIYNIHKTKPKVIGLLGALVSETFFPDWFKTTVRPDGSKEKSKNKLNAQFFEEDRKTFYGRAETMRSFMASYRSDAAGITRHAKTALEYLPESDKTWINTASMALGDAYVFTGKFTRLFCITR